MISFNSNNSNDFLCIDEAPNKNRPLFFCHFSSLSNCLFLFLFLVCLHFDDDIHVSLALVFVWRSILPIEISSHIVRLNERKKMKRKRAFSQRFNSNQFHNYVHKYKARRIQTLSCRHTHKRQRKSGQRFKISTFWRIAWQSFDNECVIFGAKSVVNFACKTILSIIFHLPNNLHSNLFGWLGNETAEKCESFHHNVMLIVESGPFRMSQIVILCTECLLLTSSLLTLLYIFGCFMLISPFKVISKRSIFKRQ